MKVLVIDDSEIARARMTNQLRLHGHTVLELPSPIGATRTVLRENVEVVVIDIHLPTVSGDRLASLFRANPRMKNLGVVLVSGIDPEELLRLAQEVDADAVVSKGAIDRELPQAVLRAKRG